MIKIDENLFYLQASNNPLSADVVIFESKKNVWVFDVGANDTISRFLKDYQKPVNVVLSHFHPDHIRNLHQVNTTRILQGKNTFRYTKIGEIVEKDLYWEEDGILFHVFPIPSSHAKGSLALEINETYCFLQDATYPAVKNGKAAYNTGVLLDEIRVLERIKAEYFAISHQDPFLKRKEEVIIILQEIYACRKPGEAFIYL